MSFYIDTEPEGDCLPSADAAVTPAPAATAFYLDTAQPRHSSSKATAADSGGGEGRKRKRRREIEAAAAVASAAAAPQLPPSTWQQQAHATIAPAAIDQAKIFYRSVSTGELGRATAPDESAASSSAADASGPAAAVAAAAAASDAPPKNRRPRFSRQAMNARFFDLVGAAAGGDGNSAGGGGIGGLDAFTPGQLSDRLRSAMGLAPDELPMHIYRMRELGYPPGWLLEAQVASSGVAIFDDSAPADGDTEEQQPVKFDISKLLKFPGFNCPLPRGVLDEHNRLGFQPMHLEDHLSAMVHAMARRNQIQAVDAYHTRRMRMARKSREAAAVAATEAEPSVDVYGSDRDEPVDAEDELNAEADDEEVDLDDLEARRLDLLRQLEEDPNLQELEGYSSSSSSSSLCQRPEEAAAAEAVEDPNASLAAPAAAVVVSTQFGSPVFSNYTTRLPDPSNFNRDIEQFRPFENLPNSTGGYSKVNSVVKKIRESLPKIA